MNRAPRGARRLKPPTQLLRGPRSDAPRIEEQMRKYGLLTGSGNCKQVLPPDLATFAP